MQTKLRDPTPEKSTKAHLKVDNGNLVGSNLQSRGGESESKVDRKAVADAIADDK